MSKKKKRRWNFSILHNGEQGINTLFAIFAVAGIAAIPCIHSFFQIPFFASLIISFVVFWSVPTGITVILGFLGLFSKDDNERWTTKKEGLLLNKSFPSFLFTYHHLHHHSHDILNSYHCNCGFPLHLCPLTNLIR